MAKRYPLSRASKAFEAICKAEPLFTAKAAEEGPLSLDSGLLAAFAAKCLAEGRRLTGNSNNNQAIIELNRAAAVDGSYLVPDDLVWVSRWRRCRQVYRIDDTVAAELPSTELDDEIPCEVFKRLPYPIVYIERRFKAPLLTGEAVDIAGFLAYTIRWNDGSDRLGIVMLRPEGGRLYTSIPCGGSVTVKSLVESAAGTFDEDGNPRPAAEFLDEPEDGYDGVADAMGAIVSSLLYIISAEDDAQIVYAPPKVARGQKPGKKTNPETVTLVGARMGRAIGQARHSSTVSDGQPTGRTVAPHIRAAHWAHYWTGKRKGRTDGRYGDEVVVRWIPPIPVNEDEGEVIETIHR